MRRRIYKRFGYVLTAVCVVVILLMWLGVALASEPMLGYATYYTEESCKREGTSGIWTANQERYDEKALTCAIRSRDWGGMYRVVNVKTGDEVLVRHNDYGPGRKSSKRGVVIDLTPEAFRRIDHTMSGRVEVYVERI